MGKLRFQVLETEADGQVINLLPVEEGQNNNTIPKVITLESPSISDKDALLQSSTQPVLSGATVKVLKAVQILSRHC